MSKDKDMSKEKAPQVEVFYRVNRLKLKVDAKPEERGSGFIDREQIKQAQISIEEQKEECIEHIMETMHLVDSAWAALKASDDSNQQHHLDVLFNYANQIKDMTETYHYDLMRHFSLSLREFCQKFNINSPEHQIIVQAHIDAMKIVLGESLREDDKRAQELKQMVSIAIKKHS